MRYRTSCSHVVKCTHVHINEWTSFHKQQIVGSARELLIKIMIEQNLFSDNEDGRKVIYFWFMLALMSKQCPVSYFFFKASYLKRENHPV